MWEDFLGFTAGEMGCSVEWRHCRFPLHKIQSADTSRYGVMTAVVLRLGKYK